jgi:hypothetical protein
MCPLVCFGLLYFIKPYKFALVLVLVLVRVRVRRMSYAPGAYVLVLVSRTVQFGA